MDSPLVLDGNEYEVKIRNKDSMLFFEDIKPTLIIHSSDDVYVALDSYLAFLERENVDISNVWEFRINRKDSPQGHYFNPTWQGTRVQFK